MPLRAKIQSAAFSSSPSSQAASTPATMRPNPSEEPDDEPDDVLFGSIYGVRTIELNRPKKLNSLNGSMARKIIPRLREWEKSQLASVIIMSGAGSKSFCAGGDVAALAQQNTSSADPIAGQEKSGDYFALEYKLDHLIATYPKPYIAYMDGITMGGGVGLSVHAPFRIATERTVFAMPETTIGFFPDVGGTFFLPRLDGYTGKYLALTSERLKGVNALWAGVATHYVHSSSLGDLTQRLAEMRFKDEDNLRKRLRAVNTTVEEFVTGLPHDEEILLAGEMRKAVDRCFRWDDYEDIKKALDKEVSAMGEAKGNSQEIREWARRTLETLKERSPTSLKVTARQMVAFRETDIAEVFRREHQLAKKFMAHPDFNEGVIARLIEKRTPQWQPPRHEDVSQTDVDNMFLTQGQRLQLCREDTYSEYPYASMLGLPREVDVKSALASNEFKNKEAVVQWFLEAKDYKVGVREKIEEVLERIAKFDKGGFVRDREWLAERKAEGSE